MSLLLLGNNMIKFSIPIIKDEQILEEVLISNKITSVYAGAKDIFD